MQGVLYPLLGNAVAQDYADKQIDSQLQLLIWFSAAMIGMPVVLATAVSLIVNRLGPRLRFVGLDLAKRTPRAWTYGFMEWQPTYARVYLSDQGHGPRVLGGVFASKSLASTDPAYADLYLEQIWELDENDWFVKAITGSRGIWISPESISRIEFWGISDDDLKIHDGTEEGDTAC